MSSRRLLFVAFIVLDLAIVGGVLFWVFGGKPAGPGKPEVVPDPSLVVARRR